MCLSLSLQKRTSAKDFSQHKIKRKLPMLIKHTLFFFCSALLLSFFTFFAQPSFAAQAKEKVLLDADMVDAFDDGIAMLMLANDPKVDLVGITTVSGNSWAKAGTASALYQLQIAGKNSIPVAMGIEYPIRAQRHLNIALERKLFGIGRDVWMGSFGLQNPQSWQEFYKKTYGAKPALAPIDMHGVDFIIDTVRKNPHEITIAAIGPCTNLALAIMKAPDIISLIKRVIYMGGSFYTGGNVTPAAEFNWWFDPEAARMAVRAPFKEQIVVGLDVAEKIVFKKEHYDRFKQSLKGTKLGELVSTSHTGISFTKDAQFTHFVWDLIVSAIIIDPSIITKEITAFIDVNDQYTLSYGQSLPYPIDGPAGAQKARIILEVDETRFWDMVNDKKYWQGLQKTQ